MKALKVLGIAVGVLVLVLVAGIAVVSSQFDGERIKAELAKAVYETKQRTLKIDGELGLSFWPNLGVTLGKLSLSEHGGKQAFASVESARVSVAVMPLLSGNIVANAVEINGAKATLVKRKDGRLNIDDLLAQGGGGDKGAKAPGRPLRLDIAAIRIANTQLSWRDEKTGSTSTVSGLDLATGRVQADTGSKVYLIDALSLAAKGKLDAESFDLRLQAPRIRIAPGKSSSDAVTLSAVLSGAQRSVDAKLRFSGIEGGARALRVAKLALELDAKSGETSVKGGLTSALAADLEHKSAALEKLSGEFTVAHPQMPMQQLKLPVSGGLKADLARQTAAGSIATRFDESKLALKFDIPRFAPLALGFDLAIDRLNLDKYLPPKKAAGGSGAGAGGGDGKVDLSALKGLNLNGAVRIGSLQVSNIKATELKLQMKAANGRLVVAPHSAKLYGGSLAGSLTLEANGNAVAAREKLSGININPLMKDAIDKDVIEGHGNLALELASRGATVRAMKQALAGSASLALKDGAVKGINLAQRLRELKAKFSGGQAAVQQAKQTDKTDFTELSASFRIANGVAHNEDLAAKSPFLRLAGSGDVDIGNDSVDYLAKASVVASAGGQGAKDLEYLKGVTVPVRVTGPYDKISYKIEFGDLARQAAKAKVEEKTRDAKQKVQDRLQDKLKGLFGR
jgi:AsmA protein